MLFVAKALWEYRSEILLAVQLLAKLRQTAQQAAREYIRRKVAARLKHSIGVALLQLGLLFLAYTWNDFHPTLSARCLASALLWAITLYNVAGFLFLTLPEIRALRHTLRGKTGYTLKYLLEVSLVTELLRMNILFLALCFALSVSTRTVVGSAFSYTKPWQQLTSKTQKRLNHRPSTRTTNACSPAHSFTFPA